jgi:hypothetical protein
VGSQSLQLLALLRYSLKELAADFLCTAAVRGQTQVGTRGCAACSGVPEQDRLQAAGLGLLQGALLLLCHPPAVAYGSQHSWAAIQAAFGFGFAPAMLACFDSMMLANCQWFLTLYVHPSLTCRTTLSSLQSNLQQYVENKYVTESTGFKALPEIINGRAAMIGECNTQH